MFPYRFSVVMPFASSIKRSYRLPRFIPVFVTCLFVSLLALAQTNLTYRLLSGYSLSSDAPVNKGKPTLFVFEQDETFAQVFTPTTTKRTSRNAGLPPDFSKELVIGIAIPTTNQPSKLSISKVFVQDSTLTVRYIRMKDTTALTGPQPVGASTNLVLAIPKQTVLKTRLVENGKVVQTLRKRETD
jgi:hypothetical protein